MYNIREEVNSRRNIIEYSKTLSTTCYLYKIERKEILLNIIFPNKSRGSALDEYKLLKLRRIKQYD